PHQVVAVGEGGDPAATAAHLVTRGAADQGVAGRHGSRTPGGARAEGDGTGVGRSAVVPEWP
ncbi:MAG: hypothetical protein EBX50_23165, partial [Chitinophagia bacterium]|nr:hypothetical protein [Chitinophagia bacterium]